MPSEAMVLVYDRLMETAEQLQVALAEDSDAQVLLELLEKHRQVLAQLKQLELEIDPDSLLLIRRAKDKVVQLVGQISHQRDSLASRIMQTRNRKRAFDAYHKI